MRKILLLMALCLAPTLIHAQAQSDQSIGPAVLNTACTNANTSCDSVNTNFATNGVVLGPASLEGSTQGYGLVAISMNGATTTATGATISFEFSDDGGTSWYQNICTRTDANIQEASEAVPSSTYRAWDCSVGAATRFRVRLTAVSSGNVVLRATLTTGLIEPAPTVAISSSPAPAQSFTSSTQTPITASSGTLAATAGTCTLSGVAVKTTYITGFQITGAGATGASVVAPTVTGVISGTMTYELAIPAGVSAGVTPLIVSFPIPVPASAVNTAIVVNIPSFGTGNTNASCVAQGFQQ